MKSVPPFLIFLIVFVFPCLTTGFLFGQKSLDLDMFAVGEQVSMYPSFKVVDSIPKGTEFSSSKFHYYIHNDSKLYFFLDRPVQFVIAATDRDGQIVSISFVTKFDDKLLTDLQHKYGRWDTASRGSASQNYDSLDTSKFSYYVWKRNKSSINLQINRYVTKIGDGIYTHDYATISHRSKAYWDSK